MMRALNIFRLPAVKIHGLLRAGTNYLEAVMAKNFRVKCLGSDEGGWKHGHCRLEPWKKYVFVVKNPYAWLVSFYDWEKIHNRTSARNLGEFIEQAVSHDQLRLEWQAEHPIDVWNKALTSWSLDSTNVPSLFVRYEDLINDFDTEMSRLRDYFKLTMRQRAFSNIESRVDTWPTPKPRKPFQIEYYKDHKYLADFKAANLATIGQQLNTGLLSRFGYDVY